MDIIRWVFTATAIAVWAVILVYSWINAIDDIESSMGYESWTIATKLTIIVYGIIVPIIAVILNIAG